MTTREEELAEYRVLLLRRRVEAEEYRVLLLRRRVEAEEQISRSLWRLVRLAERIVEQSPYAQRLLAGLYRGEEDRRAGQDGP